MLSGTQVYAKIQEFTENYKKLQRFWLIVCAIFLLVMTALVVTRFLLPMFSSPPAPETQAGESSGFRFSFSFDSGSFFEDALIEFFFIMSLVCFLYYYRSLERANSNLASRLFLVQNFEEADKIAKTDGLVNLMFNFNWLGWIAKRSMDRHAAKTYANGGVIAQTHAANCPVTTIPPGSDPDKTAVITDVHIFESGDYFGFVFKWYDYAQVVAVMELKYKDEVLAALRASWPADKIVALKI